MSDHEKKDTEMPTLEEDSETKMDSEGVRLLVNPRFDSPLPQIEETYVDLDASSVEGTTGPLKRWKL